MIERSGQHGVGTECSGKPEEPTLSLPFTFTYQHKESARGILEEAVLICKQVEIKRN